MVMKYMSTIVSKNLIFADIQPSVTLSTQIANPKILVETRKRGREKSTQEYTTGKTREQGVGRVNSQNSKLRK